MLHFTCSILSVVYLSIISICIIDGLPTYDALLMWWWLLAWWSMAAGVCRLLSAPISAVADTDLFKEQSAADVFAETGLVRALEGEAVVITLHTFFFSFFFFAIQSVIHKKTEKNQKNAQPDRQSIWFQQYLLVVKPVFCLAVSQFSVFPNLATCIFTDFYILLHFTFSTFLHILPLYKLH